MSGHQRLLASAEKPKRGPVILETLWWPRHAVGLAGLARRSIDEWRDDLMAQGVKAGDLVEFIPEDVIGRMCLVVHESGAYTTDHENVPTFGPTARIYITDQGETADSLGELTLMVHEFHEDKPERFPIKNQVRVWLVRDRIKMRLQFVDDNVLKFVAA